MNKFLYILLFGLGFISCSKNTYLVKIVNKSDVSSSATFTYKDQKGKEVIPSGRYQLAFTDTIHTIGFVENKKGNILAIDIKGSEVFQVFKNDGQPDYVSDGLFRIVKDQKLGYANMMGKIILEPNYKCAFPFYDGKAKVALECNTETKGNYSYWQSDNWIFIDKSGNVLIEE